MWLVGGIYAYGYNVLVWLVGVVIRRYINILIITRNRSLSNIGRARCAAINSDFLKIIISKYINYTIGINDNNCVFVYM